MSGQDHTNTHAYQQMNTSIIIHVLAMCSVLNSIITNLFHLVSNNSKITIFNYLHIWLEYVLCAILECTVRYT